MLFIILKYYNILYISLYNFAFNQMVDTMNVNINKFKFIWKLIGFFFLKTNKTSNQTTCLEPKCYVAPQSPQCHYLDDYSSK